MLEECSYQELKEKEHPYIRLRAEQPEQVCNYLKDALSINNFALEETAIIKIFNLKYSTLEINRQLFSAGFGVAEISMCRNSLEDHFRELTGGVGIA